MSTTLKRSLAAFFVIPVGKSVIASQMPTQAKITIRTPPFDTAFAAQIRRVLPISLFMGILYLHRWDFRGASHRSYIV